MSAPRSRSVPAPGQAPLVAPNAAALLRRNARDFGDHTAIKFADRSWSHAEYYTESCRFAALFDERLPASVPRHVGVLLDNTPDYLFAFGGAALVGAAIVGLNHTRRDEHLLRDVQHTDCGLVITEPRHEQLLTAIARDLPPVLTSTRFADQDDPAPAVGSSLEDAVASHADAVDPGLEPDVDSIWALIFTSGTSSAPKAVICSQRRLLVTGNRMSMIMDLRVGDTGYVCMPLFHSNAVQVGWAPSLVVPCAVGLGRRFSASRWLADVRRYGATYFNYTGKPLAYLLAQPESPGDSDNPLRVAFGNEGSPQVVSDFARRFGLEVIDAYGATEGGVAVNRDVEMPVGALGHAPDHVQVVDEEGAEKPRARLDAHGRVLNAEECVGEIVNTQGVGPFEGYYNNREATASTTRNGWYWSGDLGYKDEDGFLYFAGRNADWIRVDGGWLLSGQKVWTSYAQFARWGICLARTDPDAPKHKGISYLVVDMEAPGIEIRPLVQITGDAEFNEVFFDEVFVPDDHLVGGLHNGWAVANTTLAHERGTAFPFKEQVVHEVYLDELWQLAARRTALDDVEVSDALAQSFVELRVLRLHNWRTLSRLAKGIEPGPESSVTKLAWTDMTQSLSARALDIAGAAAPLSWGAAGNPGGGFWQRQWLWSKAASIAGGTSEVQRTIIGDRMLGLPR